MLIEIDDIRKILKLVLLSGYLKDNKPLSLMIIADKGLGKTELLKSFHSKNITYMTDLTYYAVLEEMKENKKLKHIIIPDFLKITMKRKSTGDNLISLFNALIEEGINKIGIYKDKYDFKGRNLGLVLATTKDSYIQQRNKWESIGFLSRFIIISYSYKIETEDKILNYITTEDYKNVIEKLREHKIKKVVTTQELNQTLKNYCNRDFRKLKQLIILSKCHALEQNRNKVNKEDINEIIRLNEFMNYNYKKI